MIDGTTLAYPQDHESGGMTLHQWYAGQALRTLIEREDHWHDGPSIRDIADLAIVYADAMIAAYAERGE